MVCYVRTVHVQTSIIATHYIFRRVYMKAVALIEGENVHSGKKEMRWKMSGGLNSVLERMMSITCVLQ